MAHQAVLWAVMLTLHMFVLFKIADGYVMPTFAEPVSCLRPSSEMVNDCCFVRNIRHPMDGALQLCQASTPVGGPFPQHLLRIVLQSGMKLPYSLYHAILKSYTTGEAFTLFDSNTVSKVEGLRNLIARYGNSKNAMVGVTEQSLIPVDVYVQAVMSTLNEDVKVEQPNGVCYPYHLYLKRYGTCVQPHLPHTKNAGRHKTYDSKPTSNKAGSVKSRSKQSYRHFDARDGKYYPVAAIQDDRYEIPPKKKNQNIRLAGPVRDNSIVTKKLNHNRRGDNLSGEDSDEDVSKDTTDVIDENRSHEQEHDATHGKGTYCSSPERASNTQLEERVARDESFEEYSAEVTPTDEEEDVSSKDFSSEQDSPSHHSNQVLLSSNSSRPPSSNLQSPRCRSSETELETIQHSTYPGSPSSGRVNVQDTDDATVNKNSLELFESNEDRDDRNIYSANDCNDRSGGRNSGSEPGNTGRVRRFKSNYTGLPNFRARRHSEDSEEGREEDLPSTNSDHQNMVSRSWDLNSATDFRQTSRTGDHLTSTGRRSTPQETGFYPEESRGESSEDESHYYTPKSSNYLSRRKVNRNTNEGEQTRATNVKKNRRQISRYHSRDSRQDSSENQGDYNQLSAQKKNYIKMLTGSNNRHPAGQTDVQGFNTPENTYHRTSGSQNPDINSTEDDYVGVSQNHQQGRRPMVNLATNNIKHRMGGTDRTSSADFQGNLQAQSSENERQIFTYLGKNNVRGGNHIENEQTHQRYAGTNIQDTSEGRSQHTNHQKNERTQEDLHKKLPRFPESSRIPHRNYNRSALSHKGQASTSTMLQSPTHKKRSNDPAQDQDFSGFEQEHVQSRRDVFNENHDKASYKSSARFMPNTIHERKVNCQDIDAEKQSSKLLHQANRNCDLPSSSDTKLHCGAVNTNRTTSDQHHNTSADYRNGTFKKQFPTTTAFPGDQMTHSVKPESDGPCSKHAHKDNCQLPNDDSKSTENNVSQAAKTSSSAEEEDPNKENFTADV